MRKKISLITLTFLLAQIPLMAQSEVPFEEILKRIGSGEREFENLTIVQLGDPSENDTIKFEHGITFRQCTFKHLWLYNIQSKRFLRFTNCSFLENWSFIPFSLMIEKCHFEKVEIINSTIEYPFRIQSSSFAPVQEASLEITNSQIPEITIEKSLFHGLYLIDNQITTCDIVNNEFRSIDRSSLLLGDPLFLTTLHIRQESIERLSIAENKFRVAVNDWKPTFLKLNTTATNLNLSNNKVSIDTDLRNLVVTNQFVIEENTFDKRVLLGKTTFSEVFNIVPFRQFVGNKIALVKEEGGNNPNYNDKKINILNQDTIDLAVESDFLRLLRVYQNLLDIYKQSGDLSSWNLAYKEKKNMETKRLKYEYIAVSSFENFFKWRLNQFILLFSDFGTNPAKAVKISFYIILLFSFIYFLFPSDWDKESKAGMLKLLKDKLMNKNETEGSFFRLIILFTLGIINALTLSINAFTTLGFGTIPTTGIPRYIAVFQGFIGWFLLSIFTVALINQVLF